MKLSKTELMLSVEELGKKIDASILVKYLFHFLINTFCGCYTSIIHVLEMIPLKKKTLAIFNLTCSLHRKITTLHDNIDKNAGIQTSDFENYTA